MQFALYIPGTRGPGDPIVILLSQPIKYLLLFVCKPKTIQILQLQSSLMPSTRKQKAKARKSREMDMMSDFENMDYMLGNNTVNTIERELSNVIGSSGNHCDAESNLEPRESDSHENGFGHFVHENTIPRQDRFQETMETFTSEINMRLSQELHMSMMYGQINRAINTAIAERVIPEIQNMVSSMSSSGNRDTEASLPPHSQKKAEGTLGLKLKLRRRTQGLHAT